eukprot:TRINITY_DN19397_c0_g1_i1.p1 TRINITY_DN19397_c0_g1~~TRINITY_DN19397_c0_g1_i1.p1  ORF type:complete len:156 (+),score=19.74 TRINITY_DN19397_c0_g1_i1:147-614(+)
MKSLAFVLLAIIYFGLINGQTCSVLKTASGWRLYNASTGASTSQWNTLSGNSLSSSAWISSVLPFGSDSLLLQLVSVLPLVGGLVNNPTPNVAWYIVKNFTTPTEIAIPSTSTLSIKGSSGYIAYINGRPVANFQHTQSGLSAYADASATHPWMT